MIKQLNNATSGKRTYALAFIAILTLCLSYLNHQVTGKDALRGIMEALAATTIRAAIGKVESSLSGEDEAPQDAPHAHHEATVHVHSQKPKPKAKGEKDKDRTGRKK
jgi:hypothetical protein